MAKVKTSQMRPLALNYAIAVIEKRDFAISDIYPNGSRSVVLYYGHDEETGFLDGRGFDPARDWSDGGPLLEKYKISVVETDSPVPEKKWLAKFMKREGNTMQLFEVFGGTYLKAGMRCLTQAYFGDEADVPEELLTCHQWD